MAATSRVDGRRERSRRTWARIVHAAAQLFVENGYVATTIEAIAERAEVANQTVYYVFGTKAEVFDLRPRGQHRRRSGPGRAG